MHIPSDIYEEIKVHALTTAPYECCGLLGLDADGDIAARYGVGNMAEDPTRSFEIDPVDLEVAEGLAADQGLRVGAVYHSHPRASAELSDVDLRLARPDLVHLVIGMNQGIVTRAWSVSEDAVVEEDLELVRSAEQPPDEEPDPIVEVVPWNTAEKNRVPPRECIRASRDALNRAYSYGTPPWPLIMEALDWQRRALEQMVGQ